ncbi:MAG: flagellin, partial [Gammaproteobacteria bacterium]|nr:flagellin [Gammaproteobacteria bacterium]
TNTLGLDAEVTADETAAAATTLAGLGVDTVAGANFAMARIDSALTAVNGLRGNLGAIQNRFESTIVNLQTVSENLSASRGRIQDADFAAETAALTKAQILQQAGVSVLSQANAQPQLALSLLQ